MDDRIVLACPHCSMQYRIRRAILGRPAKCSKCKHIFPLTPPSGLDEDEILNLVHGSSDEAPTGTVAGLRVEEDREFEPDSRPAAAKPPAPDFGAPVKLHALDFEGAHFRFAVELLKSETFRASIPKTCAGCRERKNLRVYLVHWFQKGHVPVGFGARKTVRSVALLYELPAVGTVELLKYLPIEKHLPEPFCLPFPFYVCNKCNPEGLVFSAATIEQMGATCMLTIHDIGTALEFYTANCGTETEDYRKLLTRSSLYRRSRWEAIPPLQQKKIMAWFKPVEREHFICYVPDLDTPSAQRGQTGIVITDQRMICAKEPLWRQFLFTEHLVVTQHPLSEGVKVDISSPAQGRISFRLKDTAWADLKHSLQDLETDTRFVDV